MQSLRPKKLDGWAVVAALWPLNDDFGPNLSAFRALAYDSAYEAHADAAIDRYIANGHWGPVSIEAWRVLLERHCQAIMVATLNAQAGNAPMSVPETLPHDALTGAAVLWWLYGMKLPFPPADRSTHEAPARFPAAR